MLQYLRLYPTYDLTMYTAQYWHMGSRWRASALCYCKQGRYWKENFITYVVSANSSLWYILETTNISDWNAGTGDLTLENEDHGFALESEDHVITLEIEDHGFIIELESPGTNMVDHDNDFDDQGFND